MGVRASVTYRGDVRRERHCVSEPEGRGAVWTEERGTSDGGRRRLQGAPEASGKHCGESWYRRHWVAVDVAIAVFFVLLDTGTTLLRTTWWPAHPGTLAWVMLGLQAAACASLAARRRAPLTVVGILAAFTLLVTLLIWPACALTPAQPREHMGALLDGTGGVRAVLLPAEPAEGVHRDRHPHGRRLAAVAAVGHRHHGRPAPHGGRAAYRAVLHGPPQSGAGADRARRAGRAGAPPARRAGPGRGTRPAGRRDARRRDAPGEPDGAAGRRAADDRDRRGDAAGRGGTAGRGLPGPGRAAGPGRHPAHGPGAPRGRRGREPRRAGPRRADRGVHRGGHARRAGRGRRPGPGLPRGRAHGVPHRARSPDQRPQARPRRPGAGAGQLRRVGRAPGGPQHAARGPAPRPWPAPAPGWASRTSGSASSSCTARCAPGPRRTAGSASRPRCPRSCPPPKRRCARDPGGRGRRRADGVRAPAHDPRLRRHHRGRRGSPRRGGRDRGGHGEPGPTSCSWTCACRASTGSPRSSAS